MPSRLVGQSRPILGDADLAIAFIAVATGFGGSALPENRAADGEGLVRGSTPASLGLASEGRERKLM